MDLRVGYQSAEWLTLKRIANDYTLQAVPPLAATSRAAFAPSTCSSVGSETPFLAAVTSARIDTAISGGVRLPI